MKRIAMFGMADAVAPDEAERHYLDVHHRFARNLFRDAPAVQRYVTQRALAQYDVNGRFMEHPKAWRFVITHTVDSGGLDDASEWLPREAVDEIWHDHVNFLRDLRSFEVDERCVLDRLAGQTNLVKLLFVFALNPGTTQDAAARHYAEEHVPFVQDALAMAYGARLYVANRVIRELESAPIVEPGQRYTGAYLPTSSVVGFDEYYFDNLAWAEEVLADAAVLGRLRRSGVLTTQGYLVEERTGVDKR